MVREKLGVFIEFLTIYRTDFVEELNQREGSLNKDLAQFIQVFCQKYIKVMNVRLFWRFFLIRLCRGNQEKRVRVVQEKSSLRMWQQELKTKRKSCSRIFHLFAWSFACEIMKTFFKECSFLKALSQYCAIL